MPDTLEAANIHFTADVHLHLAFKVSLDGVVSFNQFAQPRELILSQLFYFGVVRDSCLRHNLSGERRAESIYVAEGNLHSLAIWYIDS